MILNDLRRLDMDFGVDAKRPHYVRPTVATNVLRIYEVRLNEISNYKQMLVGVSCIYAVSGRFYYGMFKM